MFTHIQNSALCKFTSLLVFPDTTRIAPSD